MVLKKLLLILFILVFTECSSDNNDMIIWVSGFKTECSAGAGKMMCLKTYEGKDIENAEWQYFYNTIEGFQFEEGYLKKIRVKVEEVANPPADGSSLKYTFVEELEKKIDERTQIGGEWILNKINDGPVNRSVKLPTMKIDLGTMMLSGNGGCNQYTGKINKLTSNSISLGTVSNTSRACIVKNIERDYFDALNAVDSYGMGSDQLVFYDTNGNQVLSYMKASEKQANPRLNDIWNAVRISGNPINRMSPIPRLEINLTDMKVHGSDGCNEFTGDIQSVTDDQLILGRLASTKKMCRKMDTADAFNKAMAQVASYELDGLNLILKNEEGEEVLAFLKGD